MSNSDRLGVAALMEYAESQVANGAKTICLCGSTRFERAFREWSARLALQGHVVISISLDGKSMVEPMKDEDKLTLDGVHLRKIAMADEVLVLDLLEDGTPYFGASTQREMIFARLSSKPVKMLSEEHREWVANPQYLFTREYA